MPEELLAWRPEDKRMVLDATSLLFPERDGYFSVFHKTVVDWLTGEITEGSSVKERSEEFVVERKAGHESFAAGFDKWLEYGFGQPV